MQQESPYRNFAFESGIIEKFNHYAALLREANAKVNLLSRRDMDDVEYRHIAFCAAIGEFLKPAPGAKIADVGTGGGLPGIVAAIIYPQAEIFMFDGVGKKIKMVRHFIDELDLPNARAFNARVEEFKCGFDYATGRAVCALPMLFGFVKKRLKSGRSGNLQNGVVYFKGGEIEKELADKKIFPDAAFDLQKFFGNPLYEGKTIAAFSTAKVLRACR